jgi:hypothetical protein
MAGHAAVRRLVVGIAVLVLVTGCGGTASQTPTSTSTPAPKASATATPAPTKAPTPTSTPAPTIGEPADDGARIIAVDKNPTHLLADPPRQGPHDQSPAVGGIVHVRPCRASSTLSPRPAGPCCTCSGQSDVSRWTEYLDAEA